MLKAQIIQRLTFESREKAMLFVAQDPSPNCPSGLGNSSQRMKRLAVNSGLKVFVWTCAWQAYATYENISLHQSTSANVWLMFK